MPSPELLFQTIVKRGAADIEQLGDRRRTLALGDQGAGMLPLIVRERPLAPEFLAALLRRFQTGLGALDDQRPVGLQHSAEYACRYSALPGLAVPSGFGKAATGAASKKSS